MSRGIGWVEPRRQGFAFVSQPTCLAGNEYQLAYDECGRQSQIIGLGVTRSPSWLASRFGNEDPCVVLDTVPRCATPQCLSDEDARTLASCFVFERGQARTDQGDLCDAFSYWAALPFCNTQSLLGPVPQCLDANQENLLAYCNEHDHRGPNPGLNSYCWLAMHDPAWWMGFLAAPPCISFEYVQPPLPPPPAMTCLDEQTALDIIACSFGTAPPHMAQWCEGAWLLLNLPYCQRPSFLGPIPECLPPDAADGVAYCTRSGITGPDPVKNTVCWALMKDASWWGDYATRPTCLTGEPTPQPPMPPAMPPPEPTPIIAPPEPDDDARRGKMMTWGVVGILLLLAAGGGGYYVWRKRRR
jgi:hypothetical protein